MKEIKQEVVELRKETREGLASINEKLDCYVPRVEYEKDMKSFSERLNKNSGNWDWIVKTVMGVIIGALITKLLLG